VLSAALAALLAAACADPAPPSPQVPSAPALLAEAPGDAVGPSGATPAAAEAGAAPRDAPAAPAATATLPAPGASAAPPRDGAPGSLAGLLEAHGIGLALPREGKAIVVNIPSFLLVAVEDGEPVLWSRVIVGRPATPTPVIETATSVVRFRPTWRPTPSMIASGEYRDRRVPAGPANPLGLAAVRLEPGLLVYLHDTNRRGLFQEPDRALSHGCVRVERWMPLIAWLLDQPEATVDGWAHGTRTFDEPVPGVPVFLTHFLRFPTPDGTVAAYPDLYGLGDLGPRDPGVEG
jgi:lipoprotein-anchoring transpeptidase ErfK/SrfK